MNMAAPVKVINSDSESDTDTQTLLSPVLLLLNSLLRSYLCLSFPVIITTISIRYSNRIPYNQTRSRWIPYILFASQADK